MSSNKSLNDVTQEVKDYCDSIGISWASAAELIGVFQESKKKHGLPSHGNYAEWTADEAAAMVNKMHEPKLSSTLNGCSAAFKKWLDENYLIETNFGTQGRPSFARMAWEACWNLQRGEISVADKFDLDKARKDLKPEAWEILKQPVVQSLLYDINLLPEQITTGKHWFYMLSVLSHMNNALKREQGEIRVSFCPECGCDEYKIGHGGSPNEHECKKCGQSWWRDVDYINAIRANLGERFTKRESSGVEAWRNRCVAADKEYQELMEKYLSKETVDVSPACEAFLEATCYQDLEIGIGLEGGIKAIAEAWGLKCNL